MDTLIKALQGTPWWVYVLFFYLLSLGIKAIKPMIIPLKKLFLLPGVFLVWSLWNLNNNFGLNFTKWMLWLAALSIGAFSGWLINRSFKLKADKSKMLVTTPGGYSTLVMILLIFLTKYFFGYTYSTHPEAKQVAFIVFADILSSGVITGLFVGRGLTFLYKFKKAKSESLA